MLCSRLGDEGGHLLFGCKLVRPVWQALGLESVRDMLRKKSSANDAVRRIMELKETTRVQVVTLLWNRWLERNRVRGGERRMEPIHLACIVRKSPDEFLAIGGERPTPVTRRAKQWTRPTGDKGCSQD